MKQLFLKLITGIAACSMLCSQLTVVTAEETEFNSELDAFLTSEFIEAVKKSDYISAHYLLKDPSQYGISFKDPSEGYGDLNIDESKELQESLEKLKTFENQPMTDIQRADYEEYLISLESSLEATKYTDMEMLFLPSTGLHTNLITAYQEFQFTTTEEIEGYLTMIDAIPDLFDQAIDFTKKQAERGYFMTDSALDSTLEYIDSFTSKTDDNAMIISFEDCLDTVSGLSDEQREQYREQDAEKIKNVMIPAYQNLRNELDTLRGTRSVKGGMSEFENGLEYYTFTAQQDSGFSCSIEELIEMCKDALNIAVNEYMNAYYLDPDKLDEPTVPYQGDAEEILNYLDHNLDYLPEVDPIDYQVSYLDPTIASEHVLAYYVTPAFGDTKTNVIRVNPSVNDPSELFRTLAHEGFGGHCYQRNFVSQENANPIHRLVGELGYSEGWAMYAENLAVEHSGIDEASIHFLNAANAIGYIEIAMIDLGVNGLGWDEKEVKKQLEAFGLTSDQAPVLTTGQYDEPGILTAYGCGLAEFMILRDRAERSLGDSFNLKDFNYVLLHGGERRFEKVSEDVDAYITAQGGTSVEEPEEKNPSFLPSGSSGTTTVDYTPVFQGAAIIFAIVAVAVFFLVRKMKKGPFKK